MNNFKISARSRKDVILFDSANYPKFNGSTIEEFVIYLKNEKLCLAGSDLSNMNFNMVNFAEINLYNVDFTGSTLTKVSFSYSNLVKASFNKAELNDVDFSNASLSRVSFAGVKSSGVNLFPVFSNYVIDSVRRKPDELALRMNTYKLTSTVNYI